MKPEEDFFSQYLSYLGDTEVPAIFSRWAAIVGLGAFLGRQYSISHGPFNINPNIYSMLIGSPGTRKGTAIKTIQKLLKEAGYTKFAAERTSKEKFLLDLAGEGDSPGLDTPEELLDKNLFGADSVSSDCEMFVAIDEFNDFIGNGNIEFISMLGNMWDYNGTYRNRIKSGKSVEIHNPTISIIGGNTPTGFSLAFPTEILGQGFFSRLLLIYGEPNGKRITFPEQPSAESTAFIVGLLKRIKSNSFGTARLSDSGKALLTKIYSGHFGVHDVRFESYSNRRFTHLLKICLLTSASRGAKEITEQDVLYANTILVHTEKLMPKALGEFGKAKHSDVSHKIIQLAESFDGILTFKEMWKHVANDLEKMSDLGVLLQNLVAAEKLQQVPGGKGFLPNRRHLQLSDNSLYIPELLTAEERRMTL